MQRRQLLLSLTGLAGSATWADAPPSATLVAAWQQNAQQHIGLLRASQDRIDTRGPALPLPTRAHGLIVERDGSVLALARRPGDWLLRWNPATGQTQWSWLEDDHRLNGHGVLLPGTDVLLTTQTDRETDAGWLGVRDRATLALLDTWPTHGRDPHQLIVLPQALGRWPVGTVLVANGGIAARSETGRSKQHGERMDASLVALDPLRGALLGQWRLEDPFLSIRHLAWDKRSQRLGIALQAEHPTTQERKTAPILAIWDGHSLTPAQGQPPLQGYGGDVLALAQGGFAVGCPRADVLAIFSADARFVSAIKHPQSCALAGLGELWWNAGGSSALAGKASRALTMPIPTDITRGRGSALQFDNHWLPYLR